MCVNNIMKVELGNNIVHIWVSYGLLGQLLDQSETLYKGDDALSTIPVMHYQDKAYLCY